MKSTLGPLCASCLLACGSKSSSNATFYIDPPTDTDLGCIGVAGFDVSVTSGSRTLPSGALLNAAPVLDSSACHLTHPFSMENVDVESPVSVTVSGRDGAGVARVQADGHMENLLGAAVHLQLKSIAVPPSPVLVLYRTALVSGGQLADVVRIVVSTMKKPMTLVDVAPGPYFSVEPGAYGVPTNLGPDGTDDGLALVADVTTTQGITTRTKLSAVWNATGRYYEAK